MKVLIFAPQVRMSMQPYVASTCRALAGSVDLTVVTLDAFDPQADGVVVERLLPTDSRLRKGAALFDPRTYGRLKAMLARHAPDVVHIVNGEGYPWSVALARHARRRGIPVVTTVHDPTPHPGKLVEQINYRLAALCLASTDVVQVHKSHQVEEMQARGVAADAVAVIPHGSFADQYARHMRPGAVRENDILLFGRLEAYKGIELMLAAMPMIDPAWTLTLAGPGGLDASVTEAAAALGRRVRILNRFLLDEEVCDLLQRARIMALPYTHVTQSALPAIGAAFGMTVVASDLPGFRQEVPAAGGVLFRAGSAEDLARVVNAVGDQPPAAIEPPATFEDAARDLIMVYDRLARASGRAEARTN